MSLDVEPPAPPALETEFDADDYDDVDVMGDEYRREELETFLEEGAWERAFAEWAEDAEMDEAEFAVALELGLFERFDFFWDFNGTTCRLSL